VLLSQFGPPSTRRERLFVSSSFRLRQNPFVLAALVTAVTVAVRWSIRGLAGDALPFIPFVIPVTVAAVYGGQKAGLIATLLGAAAAVYLFVPPYYSLAIGSADAGVRLALFLVAGAAVSWLCESLHVAQRRADTERESRRAGEQALRDQEEQLERITDNTNVLLTRCTSDLRFRFVNRACAEFFGRHRSEIEGKPLVEVLGPTAFETLQPYIERALRGEVVHFESAIPYRTGVRYMDVRYVPDRGADGTVNGWFASVFDITDRRMAAQARRESEERFRELANNIDQFAWTCDEQGSATWYKPALVRVHRHHVRGHAGRRVEAGARPGSRRARRRRLPAQRRRRAGLGGYLRDPCGGRHLPVVPVTCDPDPRCRRPGDSLVRHQHRRHRASEARGRAAGNGSPEGRVPRHPGARAPQPLAPVRNAVQLLRLKASSPELQWAHEVIDRQVQQMSRLIDDLMDVSRITHGNLELRRERLELAEVLQGAVETSRPLIDAGAHELAMHLPTEPVYVDGDPTRLAQVFSNLLNNAAKYAGRPGRITIDVERVADAVEVRVRDEGVGIPQEMLSRIFDLFVQVPQSKQSHTGGLGIGLTLVKRLVAMHAGTVTAHSDGPGRGSEFVVSLPIVTAPRSVAVRDEPMPPAPAPLRVLVVDDNHDAAESVALLLGVLGYETRTAFDGIAGLEALAEFRPHVAVLDIGMPGMTGHEMASRIRETPGGREVVLVALTGWGQEADRRRSLEAGFDEHLVKPVDPAVLAQVLAAFAVQHRTA
jgi:PAS domain S-box-containing protein